MPITISGSTGVAGVDGSAATPAVQGGDTNTGMFFPAADTIAFATNGTEELRIGSAGQIGIGGANYGTSGQALVSGGSSAAPAWTTIYNATPTITAYTSGSGNWTIPSTGTFALVRAWGGGGSGGRGGATATNTGGGGGGGYSERLYQLSSLGSPGGTVAYSVAAGGTAVSAAGTGNPGGNSTFSTGSNLLTAYGGGPGTGNVSTAASNFGGGGGGALGAGANNVAGSLGGGASASVPTTVWGGGGGATAAASTGGDTFLGGAGGGGASGATLRNPGTSYGGGGNGGAASNNGTSASAGSAPAGGGGGQSANGGASGAGGAGRIEIWVW